MATIKDLRVKVRLNILSDVIKDKGDPDQRPGKAGQQRHQAISLPEFEIPSGELTTRLEQAQLVLEHGYRVDTDAIPPFVTTDEATDVEDTTGTFNGHVNPNGVSTAVRFEYSYNKPTLEGWVVCDETPLTGDTNQTVHKDMTFLPGLRVFYRVRAVSSVATIYGIVKSFKTLPLT